MPFLDSQTGKEKFLAWYRVGIIDFFLLAMWEHIRSAPYEFAIAEVVDKVLSMSDPLAKNPLFIPESLKSSKIDSILNKKLLVAKNHARDVC